MTRLSLLTCFLICGCATGPAPIVIGSAPSTEVKVAVVARCVEKKDIPGKLRTSMPVKGDVKQNAAGAAADVLALEDQNKLMYDLLQNCAEGTRGVSK